MAAIDMASAGFGSAETNAVQLGKALNDPIKGINSLTRSGITFTAQEKAKIAELVKSNQMLKAQDIILKAIETQVGGTAEASATSSGKIKASWAQIKDAFAEPLSVGIDSMPEALESVFPKIIAKAEELGKLVGTAIQDAVNGDLTRFIMIGSLIGEAIYGGAKIALGQIFVNFGQEIKKELFDIHGSRYYMTDKQKSLESKAEQEESQMVLQYRIEEFMSQMRSRYGEALALPTALPQRSGAHPNMPGVSYAPEDHPSQMLDEKGHRIMFDIKTGIDALNQKLAPQP
jgi:hypothetical protein